MLFTRNGRGGWPGGLHSCCTQAPTATGAEDLAAPYFSLVFTGKWNVRGGRSRLG